MFFVFFWFAGILAAFVSTVRHRKRGFAGAGQVDRTPESQTDVSMILILF